MKNVLSSFTLKNMAARKRRTALTLVGVCVSVAMITAVTGFLESYMQRGRLGRIADSGDWTAVFHDVPYAQVARIQEDLPEDRLSIVGDLGYVRIPGERRADRPYLLISRYDEAARATMNIRLLDGRWPENDSELLVPENLGDYFSQSFSIGDIFKWRYGQRTMPDGSILSRGFSLEHKEDNNGNAVMETLRFTGEKEFAIVGFIETAITDIAGTSFFSCITSWGESLPEPDSSVMVYLKNKAPPSDYTDRVMRLRDKLALPHGKVEVNRDLLTYYPKMPFTGSNNISSLSFFVIATIVISSFILIYNAFSISSSARTAQLGLLSSVGATPEQKRNTVLAEGIYVSLAGIPIGIAMGLAGVYLLTRLLGRYGIRSFQDFPFVISAQSIALIAGLAVCGIFPVLLLPARQSARTLPLEAIRLGDMPVKPKKIRKKQGWMRIFRIEGVLAQESIRCSKRKSRALIISLSVSLIVFFSISYYLNYFLISDGPVDSEGVENIVLSVEKQIPAEPFDAELFERLKAIPYAEGLLAVERINGIYLNEKDFSRFKAGGGDSDVGNRMCSVFVLDDEAFSSYLEELSETPLYYLERPIGVLYQNPAEMSDREYYKETDKDYFISDEEVIFDKQWVKNPVRITIGTVADVLPDLLGSKDINGLSRVLFLSRSYVQQRNDLFLQGQETEYYFRSVNHLPLEAGIREQMRTYPEDLYRIANNFHVTEVKENRRGIFSLLSLTCLLLVGILTVSTPLHALTTDLELRKREFSMLRSVGMSPESFRKMLFLEGMYYNLGTLLLAVPVSIGVNFLFFVKRQAIPLVYFFQEILSSRRGEIWQLASPRMFFLSIPYGIWAAGVAVIFLCVFFSQILAVRQMQRQNIIETMKARNT